MAISPNNDATGIVAISDSEQEMYAPLQCSKINCLYLKPANCQHALVKL